MEETVLNDSNYAAAYEAGRHAVKFDTPDGVPHVIVPGGYEIRALKNEMIAPRRVEAFTSLSDIDSFVRYMKEYEDTNYKAAIFANPENITIRGVLDFHKSQSEPGWCEHSVAVSLKKSIEWTKWVKYDHTSLTQKVFAEFLDENYVDITVPDSASVLESVTALNATKTLTFKSGVNISNGTTQLTYIEEMESKGKNNLIIPTSFVLKIPVFEGEEPINISVRLRYKIDGEGRLSFTYVMADTEKILREEFKEVLTVIQEQTGIQPYIGKM